MYIRGPSSSFQQYVKIAASPTAFSGARLTKGYEGDAPLFQRIFDMVCSIIQNQYRPGKILDLSVCTDALACTCQNFIDIPSVVYSRLAETNRHRPFRSIVVELSDNPIRPICILLYYL